MGGGRGGRFGVSVARLRRWLLTGVIVLLVALTGIVFFARWKTRKFLHDLPGKMGADIRSQANGYTYSQSVKGRTLFTVHAAKAIQRQNGKTTLHDVSLTLYGPVGSNRADTIRGAEFEYDQPNGVVRATGEVFMDLASPADDHVAVDGKAKPAGKRITATTSGLIFLQKLGVAATDQPIHLQYGELRGGATGADFETDTGVLRLRSNVQMDGVQDRQPLHLRAASAELDRTTRVATLHTADVTSGSTHAAGDTVVLDAGPSGGIDVIRADGHAVVNGADGLSAAAPKMVAHLNAASKPSLVTMTGGVRVVSQDSTGTAQEAVMHFNAAGQPSVAEMTGTVRLHETSASSVDDLAADKLLANLQQDASRRSVLHDATASGSAFLHTVSLTTPARSTTVRGDTLHAVMGHAGRKTFVAALTGAGATGLDDDDGKGGVRSSTGDTLTVTLLPPGGAKAASAIQTAVQAGHVVVTAKSAAAKGKAASETRATAARADFAGDGGRLTLTGSPVVTGDGMQMAAERVVMLQASGDAEATGAVSGVYVPADKPDAEPVHVMADHATVSNSGGQARFFGGAKAARMWTGTAQVEAPVIELERGTGRMVAHAPVGSAGAGVVHLLLPVAAAKGKTGTARVTGSSLLYVPAEGAKAAHADITGGVRMDSAGSVLTAKQAVATLSGAQPSGVMSGSVQQVVATGDVRLRQPGREGQGDRLVYTAADELYVLTGSPKVVDSQKGSITGTTLVLHGVDGSVEVSGAGTQRVHTETDAATPRR